MGGGARVGDTDMLPISTGTEILLNQYIAGQLRDGTLH